MTRKVLQAGPFTLAISLPMQWVKRFKISKGDELNVEEKGNSIEIRTKNSVGEQGAIIDISEHQPVATKIIGALYKLGYKSITALYDPAKITVHRGKEISELDMVRNTFNHLTGMHIWEIRKDGNKHSITCVEKAAVEQDEFKNTFNQLYFHVISQAERAINCSEDKSLVKEASLVETLINQSQDFCIKVLTSTGYEDYKKTAVYYEYTTQLEALGDHYFAVLKILLEGKEEVNKELMVILKENLELIRESASLYRKFEIQKMKKFAIAVLAARTKHEETIHANKTGSSRLAYHHSLSILQIISEIIETLYALNHEQFRNTV